MVGLRQGSHGGFGRETQKFIPTQFWVHKEKAVQCLLFFTKTVGKSVFFLLIQRPLMHYTLFF